MEEKENLLDETQVSLQGIPSGLQEAEAAPQDAQASLQETMKITGKLSTGIPVENATISEVYSPDEASGLMEALEVPEEPEEPEAPQAPVEYDEEDDDDPDPIFTADAKKKLLVFGAIAAALILMIGIGLSVFLYFRKTADDGKILPNVFITNINIGGLTRQEAAEALKPLQDVYANSSMQVDVDDVQLVFQPSHTGVSLNVSKILDDAYAYGREGTRKEYYKAKQLAASQPNNLPVLDYLTLDMNYIRSTVTACTDTFSSTLTQPSVQLIGTCPELAHDKIDENVKHQVLEITLGTPGRNIDADMIVDQILESYRDRVFQISVSFPETAPDDVDLNALSRTYCIAPIDASVDSATSEIHYEVYGYGFDLNEAKRLLSQATYGQTISLTFDFVKPSILGDAIKNTFFEDTLYSFQTYLASSEDRLTNLRLACQAIDGIVLQPGDSFSFNRALGERSTDKGYRLAPVYTDGQNLPEVGGGVSQVASTLYYCALYTDMEIVERHSHSAPADYVPFGMDADISWDDQDLRFRNVSENPIQIRAELRDGYVCISIMGRDVQKTYVEMEYEILETIYPEDVYQTFSEGNDGDHYDGEVLQYGSYGYRVRTYRNTYDKMTRTLLSRAAESDSHYTPRNYIICRIEPPTEPTEPSVPPTDPTDPGTEPTVPPTEATEPSTEATEPSTEATEPSTEATEPTEETVAPPEESTEPATEATE